MENERRRRGGERRKWNSRNVVLGGRIEESRMRDTILEGAIIGLRRHLALWRFP